MQRAHQIPATVKTVVADSAAFSPNSCQNPVITNQIIGNPPLNSPKNSSPKSIALGEQNGLINWSPITKNIATKAIPPINGASNATASTFPSPNSKARIYDITMIGTTMTDTRPTTAVAIYDEVKKAIIYGSIVPENDLFINGSSPSLANGDMPAY